MSEVVPTLQTHVDSARYPEGAEVSKRSRWDIDGDVIRGRGLDFTQKLLPESLSLGDQIAPEALVRLTDEELKHQELFRRIQPMP